MGRVWGREGPEGVAGRWLAAAGPTHKITWAWAGKQQMSGNKVEGISGKEPRWGGTQGNGRRRRVIHRH